MCISFSLHISVISSVKNAWSRLNADSGQAARGKVGWPEWNGEDHVRSRASSAL